MSAKIPYCMLPYYTCVLFRDNTFNFIYLIIRFHAPAIVEKPILIQKQDRKKEKQRRRTSDDENMSGTNGENSKIVMNQYMSVEKKVIFSSPNRSETVRARYRANGKFYRSSKKIKN